jgi:CheY-like chemotaxis protein
MDKDIKVLLVEDHEISRLAAKFNLQQAGCQVDVAASGKEALEKAFNNKYDIIFMDIGLEKGFDGFSVTKKIRNQSNLNQKTFIVALTAHTNDKYQKEANEAGMNKFISKPIEAVQLKEIISDFLLIKEDIYASKP